MTDDSSNFDQEIMAALQRIADEGIHNAARGFSGMIGQTLTVNKPQVKLVSLFDIPKYVGGPETEAIGIYLRAEGNLPGQIMMIIPYEKALELVDLLLCEPTGTTQSLGRFERSALQEVGNQTGTFFLNAVSNLTGISIRPTPPAVMVDMVGAILDIIIATSGGYTESVMLMQADIVNGDRSVETTLWVIPDMNALKSIVAENASNERSD